MANRLRQLTPKETAELGEFCATLLDDESPWVFRRRESVTVIDEATIRRRHSVDFSLDTIRSLKEFEDVCGRVFGEGLCVAPLFILDKDPASSLSFDLEDETGRTLSLMTTEENAEISAATLVVLCRRKLQKQLHLPLPDGLAEVIAELARSSTTDAEEWLDRLRNPFPGDLYRREIDCLLDVESDDGQMTWWLETLAVASIVMVTFDTVPNHRRVIKIAYEQPMLSEPQLPANLALRSFKVWLVTHLIRSGRYHVDITAPPDFRLTQMVLVDSKSDRPMSAPGFRRRAQLYVNDVHDARGAIAKFGLRVSGRGVLGGALVAATLAFVAIGACMLFRKPIAEGSGNNTALLLVLPGVIATYVSRADQHGLTTRLLAIPRWILLLGSGISAYYAAGVLTLVGQAGDSAGRASIEHHESLILLWLAPAAVAAFLSAAVIFFGWLFTRERTYRARRWLQRMLHRYSKPRFRIERKLRVDPGKVWDHIQDEVAKLLNNGLLEETRTTVAPPRKCVIHRVAGPISWTHGIEITATPTGTTINWIYWANSPWYLQPFLVPLVFWELVMARRRITQFAEENRGD